MKDVEEKKSRALESYLETMNKPKEPEEILPPAQAISTRMNLPMIFILDRLASQVGESRSAFMERLLNDTVYEIADHLGKWEEWNTEFAKLGLEGGKKAIKERA